MSNTIPLPEPDEDLQGKEIAPGVYERGYRKDQLRAHAAAVSAERDARIKVLESALERTATALNLAYSKKPLRDMAETLAEARAALGDKTCSD